jgi:beta-xylosidase
VTNVDVKVIETVDLSGKSGKSGFSGKIYLRLDGDFQPGHHDVANFYYSLDGENWTQIGTKDYRMIFDYRRFFMGTKFGIFNYATKKAGGYVDVDAFVYSKSEK